jgi:hypothetical protein
MIMDRSNTGIVGSNLARGADVRPSLSVLGSPVQVEVLRRDDAPPKKFFIKMSKMTCNFRR